MHGSWLQGRDVQRECLTLLHHQSTVRVLGHLQQDLLHVAVLPGRVDQAGDALLQRPRKSHQLGELALGAFVHLEPRAQAFPSELPCRVLSAVGRAKNGARTGTSTNKSHPTS